MEGSSKRRVPSSFQDAGGVKDPKAALRRDEEVHQLDSEISLETRAVCSQCKLKGDGLTAPLVPSISVASTSRIKKIDDVPRCIKVSRQMS